MDAQRPTKNAGESSRLYCDSPIGYTGSFMCSAQDADTQLCYPYEGDISDYECPVRSVLIVPTSLIDEHNYYSWNERTFNDELTLVWTKSSLENTQGKNAEPNNELQIRDGSAMFGSLLPAESPKSVLC